MSDTWRCLCTYFAVEVARTQKQCSPLRRLRRSCSIVTEALTDLGFVSASGVVGP